MLSKISLGLSAVLAVCVIFLFTKLNSSEQDSAEILESDTHSIAKTDLSGSVSVAYVVEDSILANYQYVIDEAPNLENRTEATAMRYNRALEEYQIEAARWQEYLASPGATEADQAKAVDDMTRREKAIQSLEIEIEKMQLDFNSEVFLRVTGFLESYSEQNNIDIVLNRNLQNPNVLYSNAALDITEQVVAGLNREYALEKSPVE